MTLPLGKLNFTIVKDSVLSALRTSTMVLFILVGARILGQALSLAKVPAQLCEIVLGWGISPLWVWLGVVVIYLILGCFMDGISLMLFTLPVTYPLMIITLGFDPIWFGVLVTILVECALIIPPCRSESLCNPR